LRGLEPGGIGRAIVRSHYHATTIEDTEGWRRLVYFINFGNSDDVIVICRYNL
jgi:hypothetical protein